MATVPKTSIEEQIGKIIAWGLFSILLGMGVLFIGVFAKIFWALFITGWTFNGWWL